MIVSNAGSIPNKDYEILGMLSHFVERSQFCPKKYDDAVKKMIGEAALKGANGIIGLKTETTGPFIVISCTLIRISEL